MRLRLVDTQDERCCTHIIARYDRAMDFILDYATHLRTGAIFLRGVTHLAPLSEVSCDLDLPGTGRLWLRARVVQVTTPASACPPERVGSALEILTGLSDVQSVLFRHLLLLGRRQERAVYADEDGMRSALEAAGYVVRRLPGAAALPRDIASSEIPVVGVVVPRRRAPEYSLDADIIRCYETLGDVDGIVQFLDGRGGL